MRTDKFSAVENLDGAVADEGVEILTGYLGGQEPVVLLCGAGLSTASGIPDYRGPQGVWTMNPDAPRPPALKEYLVDLSLREAAWQRRLTSPIFEAAPNLAHYAIAAMVRSPKTALTAVITQNIDGLQSAAGTPQELVIELHGSVHRARCLSCGWVGEMLSVLERVRHGERDPRCQIRTPAGLDCGGVLSSATVGFGDRIDSLVMRSAAEHLESAGVLVVVGSSLRVKPASELVRVAAARGKAVVLLNGEPTPYDDLVQVRISDDIARLLPRVADEILGETWRTSVGIAGGSSTVYDDEVVA